MTVENQLVNTASFENCASPKTTSHLASINCLRTTGARWRCVRIWLFFFFLRAVVNILIQTLIIPPRLLFRKMIISQLEHGPSVRERVEKNKHCSTPTWITMKIKQPLDPQPFVFLQDFLQLSEVGVCICLKSNTSDFHGLFRKRRVECSDFLIYTVVLNHSSRLFTTGQMTNCWEFFIVSH